MNPIGLAFGDDADRCEVKPQMFCDLAQLVVVDANSIVDACVAIRAAVYSVEDLSKRRSCGVSLASEDVLV